MWLVWRTTTATRCTGSALVLIFLLYLPDRMIRTFLAGGNNDSSASSFETVSGGLSEYDRYTKKAWHDYLVGNIRDDWGAQCGLDVRLYDIRFQRNGC